MHAYIYFSMVLIKTTGTAFYVYRIIRHAGDITAKITDEKDANVRKYRNFLCNRLVCHNNALRFLILLGYDLLKYYYCNIYVLCICIRCMHYIYIYMDMHSLKWKHHTRHSTK